MSKLVAGFFGTAALMASLGVTGLAVGNNLAGNQAQIAATAQSNLINRAAKTDRPAGVRPVAGDTIVTKLSSLDDTSLAIRVPRQTLQRDSNVSKASRRPVACEAPASVLTEVAQQMESGRCVT